MDTVGLISLERGTMPVSRMRKMLGLGKTASYWLLKKGYFKTLTVNGRIRIETASFEEWYSLQTRYKKVDGPPPGSRIREVAVTVPDLAAELGVSDDTVYGLIRVGALKVIRGSCGMMVTRESFQEWYHSQCRFRTAEDRMREAGMRRTSLTMPEIARLLGIERAAVYQLMKKAPPGTFDMILLEGRKRVTAESFEKWYRGQTDYHKVMDIDLTDGDVELPVEITAPWKLRPGIDADAGQIGGGAAGREAGNGPEPGDAPGQGGTSVRDGAAGPGQRSGMLSAREAAGILGIHKNTLYAMIESQRIHAVRTGSSYRISRAEMERVMHGTEGEEEQSWRRS